jgi:hypothetical protein
MAEMRYEYKMSAAEPQMKKQRPAGPPPDYEDNIKMEVKESGCEVVS